MSIITNKNIEHNPSVDGEKAAKAARMASNPLMRNLDANGNLIDPKLDEYGYHPIQGMGSMHPSQKKPVVQTANLGGKKVDLVKIGDIEAYKKAKRDESITRDGDYIRNPFHKGTKLDLKHYSQNGIPERKWLIKDWLPHGKLVGLFGDGGIGKSLVVQQLMTALSLNKEIIKGENNATDGVKCIGIFCEDDNDELAMRQRDICERYETPLDDEYLSEYLSNYSMVEDGFVLAKNVDNKLSLTKVYQFLEDEIVKTDANLAVVDNISNVFAANKSSEEAVGAFMIAMNQLCSRTNCTIILVGHVGKANADGIQNDFFGSVAFNNNCRCRWSLKKETDKDKGDYTKLTVEKNNYGPRGQYVNLLWKAGSFDVLREGLVEEQVKRTRELNLDKAKEIIVKYLKDPANASKDFSKAHQSTRYFYKNLMKDGYCQQIDSRTYETALEQLIDESVIEETDLNKRNSTKKLVLVKSDYCGSSVDLDF